MVIGEKRGGESDKNPPVAKKPTSEPPVASPEVQNDAVPRPEPPQNVFSPKHFVLKHTFKNVSCLTEKEGRGGPAEDHFGLNVFLSIERRDGYLGLDLNEKRAPGQWHLSMEASVRIFGRKEKEWVDNRAIEDPPFTSIRFEKRIKWESLPAKTMPRPKRGVQKTDDGPPAKNSAPEPQNSLQKAPGIPEVPEIPVIPAKSFSIVHEFRNYSPLEVGASLSSDKKEYFGISWEIRIVREPERIKVLLGDLGSWRVNLDYRIEMRAVLFGPRLKAQTRSGNLAVEIDSLRKYSKLEAFENYINDKLLTVRLHIHINEQSLTYRRSLRTFDSSVQELSDTVLIVGGEKFYVSKLVSYSFYLNRLNRDFQTLASHSSFFKSLFLGPYKEATMPEITLQGVDKFDIQNFLECIYLEYPITDETVEGILLLADQYDTPIVKTKCEYYLKKKSKKDLKLKYELFIKYNCDIKRLLDSVKTHAELKEAVGTDLSKMDAKTMKLVLQKSLSFAH
ncbi:hypothetical protein CAEBREN_14087 [Caenorhabditis brenneri]|uniref:BTB domain-containing protein n=1 Tax=Caenorhabditis brenneri TaxID=135651 RepID=G0MCQ1_CAEBE|nr:hypothetical protein CAEBREN_14087 [Caenorhabditis brenneri]